MQKTLSRRSAITLSAAAAAAIAARPAAARPAVVPVIWDGKKMDETFKAQGTGFSYPGPADRPVAYVAIDPQCPDCMKFTENVKPLLSKVNVIFFPIVPEHQFRTPGQHDPRVEGTVEEV